MNKELVVVQGKVIEQEKSYHAGVGKQIGYEQGAKMVKAHYDQHPNDAIAHFMGKDHIERILAQPGCVGIRSFYGLNEMGIKTMVLVGVDQNGRNILEINNGIDGKTDATILCTVKLCPPYCGSSKDDLGDSSGWW